MIELARCALVGFRRAIGFRCAIERTPQVAFRCPLHVVGNEQVEFAIAVVIQPCRARAEVSIADARGGRHVAELAAAFVMEKVIAVERGDVDVVAAVVVEIADGHAHSVHLHIQAAAGGDVGEGAVMIVAVKRAE